MDFKEQMIRELDQLDWPNVSSRQYHEAAERAYRNAIESRLAQADFERKRREEEGNQ